MNNYSATRIKFKAASIPHADFCITAYFLIAVTAKPSLYTDRIALILDKCHYKIKIQEKILELKQN